MALFFASRGIGSLDNYNVNGIDSASAEAATADEPGVRQLYDSPARVLLSGLGSDELLGGYSRHRAAFAHNGWEGLLDEVSPT